MYCEVHTTVFVEEGFLQEMGLYEEIEHTFERAGSCISNVDGMCEFLVSLELLEETEGIHYRHRDTYYTAMRMQLNEVFGWGQIREWELDTHSNRDGRLLQANVQTLG